MTIRPLSPELQEKARKELNEDPKRIASDLQHIKDWISKQPHLRVRSDDQWLVSFLRGCKYSLERTKEKIDLYYSLRTLAPELYSIKYNNPILDEFLSLGAYIILPKTAAPDSPRTAIIRPGTFNAEKMSMSDFFSVAGVIQTMLLNEDDTMIIAGIQWIVDLKDVTIGHLLQMTPRLLKRMTVHSQDAAPIRMKGVYFANAPGAFEKLLSTIKSFLNEKNRNRIFVCKNNEDLYKCVPKAILPQEYGGDSVSTKEITDYWISKKNEYNSWLEEDEKYGSDESKRPGQPKTAETLFGVEGSFRQLDFD
uniref:CTD5 n=1 Tax=Heliconius melpomene TaxID=34740 RepID=A0A2H4RMN9_HELME|nr:CTD5 [Heliconius melpomene]